jgi:hypothetical protein
LSGAAKLGYGSGDEGTVVSYGPNAAAKYVTTYFRHRFTVSDPSVFSTLNLRVLRDDGAVVYLNGTEIRRDNMPTGTITYTTTAPTNMDAADELTFFASPPISPASLVTGDNVLAVEVHQKSVGSSDLAFDLELLGGLNVRPPTVLEQPQSQSVLERGTITFNVSATGTTPFGYQWYFQGTSIAGASNSSLTLSNVQLFQAGDYYVAISNRGGTATSTVARLTVVEGDEVKFAAGRTNGPASAEVSIPIQVRRFTDISSFQFSLHWTASVAQYAGVDQLALTGAIGFGTTLTSNGTLTVSWDDITGSSQTLPDDTTLFAIRARLIGAPGTASPVWIDSAPTPIEVVDGNLQGAAVSTVPGEIIINPLEGPSPSASPRIGININSDGAVCLYWNAYPDMRFRVQYTTNLSDTSWIDLDSDVVATGSAATAVDVTGMTQQRFYRVLLMD